MTDAVEKSVSAVSIPNPNNYEGFTLWQRANKWEKYVNSYLKQFNLNQAEAFHLISLAWLLNNKGEVTQTDLAQYVATTAMNTSKILKKLEINGLITRLTGTDSRSKALLITEVGQEILRTSALGLGEANNQFFHTLGS